jgi:hypothetical protein
VDGVEYSVPAKLRWCKTAADAMSTTQPPAGTCGAVEIDGTKDATGGYSNKDAH